MLVVGNKTLVQPFTIYRRILLQFVYTCFLVLNIMPFFFRNQYEIITRVNYSLTLIILFVLVTLPRNLYKQIYLYFLLFISILLFLLGNSGSIFSILACSIFPIILFYNFSNKEVLFDFIFPPIIIASVLSIIAVVFIFLNTYDILTEFYFLGEYFVIASINYVPLTLFNFAIVLYLILQVNYSHRHIAISNAILLLLTISCLIASFVYLTKTVLFGSIFLLLLQARRKYLLIILCIMLYVLTKYHEMIVDSFIVFMGTDPSEFSMKDDRRFDSALVFVTDSMKFRFNYRETQSFSTLLNLLFSIFPLSLFLAFPLINVIRKFDFNIINQFALFCIMLLLTSYQMDFMSIFTLFFTTSFITYFKKHSVINE